MWSDMAVTAELPIPGETTSEIAASDPIGVFSWTRPIDDDDEEDDDFDPDDEEVG